MEGSDPYCFKGPRPVNEASEYESSQLAELAFYKSGPKRDPACQNPCLASCLRQRCSSSASLGIALRPRKDQPQIRPLSVAIIDQLKPAQTLLTPPQSFHPFVGRPIPRTAVEQNLPPKFGGSSAPPKRERSGALHTALVRCFSEQKTHHPALRTKRDRRRCCPP